LLSIFVSFAFPEEYANDFILRDYLQNQLWNGHVFTNYVEYYASQSPDFIASDFIAFVLEKNVLDSVDKFENFLLSKILKAMIEKNVDYPLLCDTLKDLETFKSSCEIMYAPTIVRAPGAPLSVHFKPKPSEAGTKIIAKDATIVAGLAKMEGSTSIAIHPAALHAKPPLSKSDKILRDKAKELLDQAYPADDPGFQAYREEKLNLLIQFNDALPKERNVLRNSVKELIQDLESVLGIESTVKIEQRIG
jgi:hypothetical protein